MDEVVDRNIQEGNLSALARNGAFQFTDTFFPYTSGQIGPYYVQSIDVTKNGKDYKMACMHLALLVQKQRNKFDVISGGESRDWDFSNPVATILELPHAKIYKDGKVLGADVSGKNVAHVADLNNEGSSPRDLWVPAIRKREGNIEDIFFYVDRMEDGVQIMNDLGLRSHAVVLLDKVAWSYLRANNIIPLQVYTSLMRRMEDKDSWARGMLRSEGGFKRLLGLAIDPHNFLKARKVIFEGYLDMKEELHERMSAKYGEKL